MTTAQLLFIVIAGSIAGGAFLLIVTGFILKKTYRPFVQQALGQTLNRMLSDDYSENILELWSAVSRTSFLNILEIGLRAQSGTIIKRPLGSPRKFPGYDGLMFVPGQLARLPLEPSVPVEVKVRIGPKAKEPVTLEIPLIISGMGYGIGLSEQARIALAKGARQAKVAINSGEGPYLKEEREEAGIYIRQISRAPWGRNSEGIADANMIEVLMGHGAHVGAHVENPFMIKGKAQKLMRLSPVQSAVTPAVPPEVKRPQDWIQYVKDLRQEAGPKPIGIKIMASGHIERDLAVALEAGFDFITVGGCEGGTTGTTPTIEDDIGIPSILALTKTVKYLHEQGARKEVSLIVSGGYFTPGECLKALALGADAVALGTVPLFALIHGQLDKLLPWEPLTQLVWYDGKYKERLDVVKASQSVGNVFTSFVHEMEELTRVLGKTSFAEVGPNDLVALDQWSADISGVDRAW